MLCFACCILLWYILSLFFFLFINIFTFISPIDCIASLRCCCLFALVSFRFVLFFSVFFLSFVYLHNLSLISHPILFSLFLFELVTGILNLSLAAFNLQVQSTAVFLIIYSFFLFLTKRFSSLDSLVLLIVRSLFSSSFLQ